MLKHKTQDIPSLHFSKEQQGQTCILRGSPFRGLEQDKTVTLQFFEMYELARQNFPDCYLLAKKRPFLNNS